MATIPTAGARTPTPGPKRPGMANPAGQPKRKRRWLLWTLLSVLLLVGIAYGLGRMVEPVRKRLHPLPLVGSLLFSDPVWPVLWNKSVPTPEPARPAAAESASRPAEAQPTAAETAAAQELRRLETEASARLAAAAIKESELKRREGELATREEALKARERSIADQERQLGAELKRTTELSARLEGDLRSEQDRVEVIRAMKSSAVLAMFGTMTDTEVIQVLKYMDAAEVAKLLAGLDPNRSTRLLLELRRVTPATAP